MRLIQYVPVHRICWAREETHDCEDSNTILRTCLGTSTSSLLVVAVARCLLLTPAIPATCTLSCDAGNASQIFYQNQWYYHEEESSQEGWRYTLLITLLRKADSPEIGA